jgi:hypothetical protein
MNYKIIPFALKLPINIDRLQRTASYYSNGKFFLEIYGNGTCVFPEISSENKPFDGRNLLSALIEKPIDFTVREMDDHNFIVAFSPTIFSIVFNDDFEENKATISTELSATTNDEFLVGKSGVPEEHLLIGLYARTRLLADIKEPKLLVLLSPK